MKMEKTSPEPEAAGDPNFAGNPIDNMMTEKYFTVKHSHVEGVKEFLETFQLLQQTNKRFIDKDFPLTKESIGTVDAE